MSKSTVGATNRQGSAHSGRRLPWQRPHAGECHCKACNRARDLRTLLTGSSLTAGEREALAARCAAEPSAKAADAVAVLALHASSEGR